jgi:DNA-binding response OmpR family regulator
MFKILVIDDDVDLLFLGSFLLRQKGFDVFSLAKTDNLFYSIGFFKPDLILLDVKLGDQDGRNICRQIKENPGTNSIKIILYSAFPETSIEYAKYGADDFIVKPYELDHLVARINHHLNARDFDIPFTH